MDLVIWAKTLLTVHRYHERMIKALSVLVQKRALASIHSGAENQAFTVTSDILKMLERKENLATLSMLTGKALAAIHPQSAQLLMRCFFDEIGKEKLAHEFGFCERTIYRKINSALCEFCSYISSLGYNCENLCKICASEKWITSTYDWVKEDAIHKNATKLMPIQKRLERQFS